MHTDNRGFTLTELITVTVLIAILASIVAPSLSKAREKAFIATVTSDLKVFAVQQETYQSSNQIYATDPAQLTDLIVSEGVTISINEANAGVGWAATAVHEALPTRPCGIFYGNASAGNAAPAASPGVVTCTD